jgi:hypothetical protein
MSMSAVKRAFIEAIGSHASCHGARMLNLEGGRQNRLEIDIVAGGQRQTLTEDFPAKTDLTTAARTMAENFIASQGE